VVSQQRKHVRAPGRASDERRAGANAIPEAHILDVTYGLLLDVGLGGTSMAGIARRAGVSRATLYRRWPNVHAVVAALMTREFAAMTERAFDPEAPSARSGLVLGVVRMVRAVREHPLVRKIVAVDPEFLLPYLLVRRGTSTEHQLQAIEAAIRAGRRDHSIRRGNAAVQARTVWLTALPFALTAPVLVDDDVSLAALERQCQHLLDRYLAP